MSMIDLFKEFHSQAEEREYLPAARLLGYWFIGAFNEAFWQEELRFSETELSRLTGIPNASIHRAVKYLCDRGFLKTWKKNNKTIFKLLSDKVPPPLGRSTGEVTVEQNPLLNIPLSKVITEDNKTNAHARNINNKEGEKDFGKSKTYRYDQPRRKTAPWIDDD